MSTRSLIGIKNENGEIRSIYCHSDGYPSWNGAILLKYYNTPEIINALIDLGDISRLRPKLAPHKELDICEYPSVHVNGLVKHTFDTPHTGVTVAYHRDRGDTLVISKYCSEIRFYRSCKLAEYYYLFKDGRWYVNRQLLTEETTQQE